MMISEFEQWLRSRTNQEKRPFQVIRQCLDVLGRGLLQREADGPELVAAVGCYVGWPPRG
jgi:hypothetical protein